MKSDITPRKDYSHGPALEPRVAKLEVGMERLTDDVRDLAQVVRSQGSTMEQEIHKLVIAVTQAQGPKKIDWSTIIAGIMLILAIGGAAFWPLNNQVKDVKDQVSIYHTEMVEHMKMDNHPYGAAVTQRLDDHLKVHTDRNKSDFESMYKFYNDQRDTHEKLSAAQHKLIENEIERIQAKNDLYIDKLWGRVQVLENERTKTADKEHDELTLWRQKAMGLSSPNVTVPLITKEMIAK